MLTLKCKHHIADSAEAEIKEGQEKGGGENQGEH